MVAVNLRLFVAALTALFLALLLALPWKVEDWQALLFWTAVTALLAQPSVPLSLLGNVSLPFLGALTLVFSCSPPAAALAASLALPLAGRPILLERELFNRSQVGLATLAASWVHAANPGIVGAFLAGAAYFLVNTAAMLLLAWVRYALPPLYAWRRNFAPYGPTYVAGALGGTLSGVLGGIGVTLPLRVALASFLAFYLFALGPLHPRRLEEVEAMGKAS